MKALIFDLDGVIINSEELHARAKRLTLHKYDIPYSESIFDDFKGRPDLDFWSHVVHEYSGERFSVAGLDAYKRNAYISLTDELQLIPGVMEYIRTSRRRFPKTGLVTSATAPDFAEADKRFGIRKWIDLVILGEDTVFHKPHPDPYLKAMAGLDASGSETIVIEDSPNGITSAKKAGCYVIGIATGFPADRLRQSGADQVVHTFAEIASIQLPVSPAHR
jgi:beta-phosphoglucomutase